ncbi:hypothetical protein [Parvularcula maris]|uniref:hypothetical protein n=1 Tax=Parvularcula maris TaxID=2965077 RepID=UPI002114583D|nr:hypothetical protein [Parvularcula maris]
MFGLIVCTLAAGGCALTDQSRHTKTSDVPPCFAAPEIVIPTARASYIATGTYEVPDDIRGILLTKQSAKYVSLPWIAEAILKGPVQEVSSFQVWSQDNSLSRLLGKSDEAVVVFLVSVPRKSVTYHLLNSPAAVQAVDELLLANVHHEIERQALIVSRWQPDRDLPFYTDVEKLISKLSVVDGAKQQRVFDELIELGTPAIPAIIDQMDNRAQLRTSYVRLSNQHSDSFEAYRQYSPELVVDAIAAILNHQTGEYFGSIYNGDEDDQRDATVAGWRVYAHDLKCSKA